jgi:hypothetical protein
MIGQWAVPPWWHDSTSWLNAHRLQVGNRPIDVFNFALGEYLRVWVWALTPASLAVWLVHIGSCLTQYLSIRSSVHPHPFADFPSRRRGANERALPGVAAEFRQSRPHLGALDPFRDHAEPEVVG